MRGQPYLAHHSIWIKDRHSPSLWISWLFGGLLLLTILFLSVNFLGFCLIKKLFPWKKFLHRKLWNTSTVSLWWYTTIFRHFKTAVCLPGYICILVCMLYIVWYAYYLPSTGVITVFQVNMDFGRLHKFGNVLFTITVPLDFFLWKMGFLAEAMA